MTRTKKPRTRFTSAILAGLAALLVAPATQALGVAGISLNRDPAPPAAAKIGVGSEQINYTITYDSRGSRVIVRIVTLQGVPVTEVDNRVLGDVDAQPGRVVTTGGTPIVWNVPAGTQPGRYFAEVRFFSNGDLTTPEATATAAFDVAPVLGNLRLEKYEDLNANGVRDVGEPGVPNWRFALTNPSGGQSEAQTGADGTITLTNVPAGTWQVTEISQPGWVATSPTGGPVVVPSDGTGTFRALNTRPGVISGTVFVDTNTNGRLDVGEAGYTGGANINLTGTDGLGRSVTAQSVSTSTGGYIFPSLLPGTYNVSAGAVPGFRFTTPTSITGISLVSNGNRPDNNFGLVQGPTTATPNVVTSGVPGPPTTLAITKAGPPVLVPGAAFTYRISVRNAGTVVARNVVVRDPIPNLVTVIQRPAGATVENGVIVWRLGNLAVGQRRQLIVRARLASGAPAGTYRNTAEAVADNADRVIANTTGRVTRARRPPVGAVTG